MPVMIGLLCALVVSLPAYILGKFDFDFAFLPLGIGVTSALIQMVYFSRTNVLIRAYDGIADFFIHIHSRYVQETPFRWFYRGFISFFLHLNGSVAGIEGAAAEWAQSLTLASRTKAEQWNENRRRTDVACVLAASIAAAFQAPFAAVVFCFEIGTGGFARAMVLSSLTAYMGTLFLSKKLGLEIEWAPFFQALPQGEYEWWKIGLCTLVLGLIGGNLARFFRFYQESLVEIFRNRIALRAVAGGAVITLIHLLHRSSHGAPMVELTSLLSTERGFGAQFIYALAKGLSLATVLAGFGTVGIFTPLFTFGAAIGSLFLGGVIGVFTGAAALWAGILGAPLSIAALCLETTRSWKLAVVVLVVGTVCDQMRKRLKQTPLLHQDLEARGLSLLDGRSESVLRSLCVEDAMVRDHEWVFENELVKNLDQKFLNSKHPFLPVVNKNSEYVGLLTLDLLQSGIEHAADHETFFEVKDLLIRVKNRVKTVRTTDSLAITAGLFGEQPCVAVVDEYEKVVGLLFAYAVRATYDREVARRALAHIRTEARR